MRDLLFHFGITLGKRHTEKQKKLFLNEMEEMLNENGMTYEIIDIKKSLFKSKHLIVGDISKAKTLFCAYYDTPNVSLLNLPYFPLIIKDNIKYERINLLINTLCFLVVNSLLVLIYILTMELAFGLRIIILFIELIVFVLNIKLFEGIQNTVNHNRNSASIVLMIHLIKQNLKNCAYVFVDNASTSLVGFEQLKEYLNKSQSKKVILDSLANGENIFLASQNTLDNYRDVTKINSDGNYWFNQLTNACVLTSGKLLDHKIRVENTRRFNDYKVDLERLYRIENLLINSVEREENDCL